ncbi:MAG: hypothetical protein K9J12_12295 [Melioribacteraceae bacterium]|nr:hypothetical protein [Melioribacteraceae bacterium]MCF8263738.1 hypothetical protein [Melioribacteraceae bacterium]MCF8412682.1 hypothetical protein [Melioribacteraceae bacterium]MCF8430972.1 hypothetical protein [Melioribacteraceae bacterium]
MKTRIMLGIFISFNLLIASSLTAQNFLDDLKLSGQWFLAYQKEEVKGVQFNEFNLKRGYVTVEKKFDDHFSARITQDVSVDQDGDGEGDIEVRLKYMYLRYLFGTAGFLHHTYVEFGLVRRPWLDFEQKINKYRVQGSMFLDRNKILSSADYGVTLVTLLGGEMDADYKVNVNKSYPGKYGSIAVGIYNGGGYHAIEKNTNKVFDCRVSIRPLPTTIPGLQLSYLGTFGKGNVEIAPDFIVNSGYLSYQNRRLTLMGAYYSGKGNEAGTSVDNFGNSYDQSGYSMFGDFEIIQDRFSVFGRYDYFEIEMLPDNDLHDRIIFGAAYHLLRGSKIIIDVDSFNRTNYTKRDYLVEFAVEVRY